MVCSNGDKFLLIDVNERGFYFSYLDVLCKVNESIILKSMK